MRVIVQFASPWVNRSSHIFRFVLLITTTDYYRARASVSGTFGFAGDRAPAGEAQLLPPLCESVPRTGPTDS